MKETATSDKFNFANFRAFENTHILLWLIKDTCWALEFKPGGIFMIIPTVAMALFLLVKSAANKCEFLHNIAVFCWILANSVWMLGEFFEVDSRIYAAALFVVGLSSISVYYLFYYKSDRQQQLKNANNV